MVETEQDEETIYSRQKVAEERPQDRDASDQSSVRLKNKDS